MCIRDRFNIALDLYFILELGWGVKGAALATVIAQTLASAYCLWKLCRIEVLACLLYTSRSKELHYCLAIKE